MPSTSGWPHRCSRPGFVPGLRVAASRSRSAPGRSLVSLSSISNVPAPLSCRPSCQGLLGKCWRPVAVSKTIFLLTGQLSLMGPGARQVPARAPPGYLHRCARVPRTTGATASARRTAPGHEMVSAGGGTGAMVNRRNDARSSNTSASRASDRLCQITGNNASGGQLASPSGIAYPPIPACDARSRKALARMCLER